MPTIFGDRDIEKYNKFIQGEKVFVIVSQSKKKAGFRIMAIKFTPNPFISVSDINFHNFAIIY